MSAIDEVITHLAEKFGADISEFAGEKSLTVPADKMLAFAQYLSDEAGFELLSCVTAIDYWPQESPRFHLAYRFNSISRRLSLNVRVPVPGVKPVADSLEKIYYNANWQEREVFDMFGIWFEGHSDLRRILMPHDWQGHPLRKDYPLGYEEPQFTFNFDEIDLRKPYAKKRDGA